MAASVEPNIKPRRWLGVSFRVVRILVLSYLGIMLVFLFFENWFVYPLSTAADFWRDPPTTEWQDLYLEIDDGTKIHAWWCPHPGAEGAMLYCHGNGGNLSHRVSPIGGIQDELNVSVLIFDYPGYGKSEGRPSEAGCYAAGEVCYRWLTEQKKIPGEKILLFGNSLGGGIATHLAVKSPHRALILSKTFTSIPDVGQCWFPFLPVRWLARNRFDSLSRIKDCTKPVFITHGKRDGTIPYWQGEALYEAANAPKRFLSVDEGDHNAPLDEEFFTALKAFLAETEAKPAPVAAAR